MRPLINAAAGARGYLSTTIECLAAFSKVLTQLSSAATCVQGLPLGERKLALTRLPCLRSNSQPDGNTFLQVHHFRRSGQQMSVLIRLVAVCAGGVNGKVYDPYQPLLIKVLGAWKDRKHSISAL